METRKRPHSVDSSKLEFRRRAAARGSAPVGSVRCEHPLVGLPRARIFSFEGIERQRELLHPYPSFFEGSAPGKRSSLLVVAVVFTTDPLSLLNEMAANPS